MKYLRRRAVPYGGFGRELRYHAAVLYGLKGELVGRVVVRAERLHVHELPGGNLVVDVVALVFCDVLVYVFCLEIHSGRIGAGYYEQVEPQGQQRDKGCGHHVWHHHAVIAYAAGKDSDDLRVCSHAGREEDDRYEYEERREHVYEIRDEVHVVVEYYRLQGNLVLHEFLDLLRDVEDDDYQYDEQERYEEGHEELLHYVAVQYFGFQGHYSLWLSFFTACSFHAAKSPASMCVRAVRTKSR